MVGFSPSRQPFRRALHPPDDPTLGTGKLRQELSARAEDVRVDQPGLKQRACEFEVLLPAGNELGDDEVVGVKTESDARARFGILR